MKIRPRRMLTLVAVAMLCGLTSSCSPSASSSLPTPSSYNAEALRAADGRPLLVQCAITRGLMKRPTGEQTWLHGTKVAITQADAGNFNEWYALNLATMIAGKELSQWVQSAAANDKLPSKVCGTSASASALQNKVFAQSPAAGDPWGT
jgi:hypothetical protein